MEGSREPQNFVSRMFNDLGSVELEGKGRGEQGIKKERKVRLLVLGFLAFSFSWYFYSSFCRPVKE